jgi:hypothetical protein
LENNKAVPPAELFANASIVWGIWPSRAFKDGFGVAVLKGTDLVDECTRSGRDISTEVFTAILFENMREAALTVQALTDGRSA